MATEAQRESAEARLMDGTAWDDFCDRLKAVGRQVRRPEIPADPFTRAEGYRYLTRVLRSAFDIFTEHADPLFPVLYRPCDEMVKYGGDDPDKYLQKCVLSGACDYRIRGKRGTIQAVSFLTQGSNFGQGGTMLPTGFLDTDTLQVEPDGTFEILVSAKPQPGNWLPMTADTQALLIRQTFGDRAKETIAELSIECLHGRATPDPLDPAKFAAGLESAVGFLDGTVNLFCDWSARYQQHPNALPQEDPEICRRVGGDPAIAYFNSYWQLAPDEALVVELSHVPECRAFSLQVCNYWMESLDYRYHRTNVNKATAQREPDGSVRIIIAAEDPGHPNWITTAGHANGTLLFRLTGAKEIVQPTTRVVKASELRRALRGGSESGQAGASAGGEAVRAAEGRA
ncbi:MAG: DUF1214 domain-containing protein [Myxococcota bacterium]